MRLRLISSKAHRIRFLFIITLIALSGCVLHVSERNIVHPRTGKAQKTGVSADGAWTIEALSISVNPTVTLRGAFFRRPNSKATLLYFGGNGFVLSKHFEYVLRIYKDLPVDVVAFDHRGYGGSTGTASIEALMHDGTLVYDHVKAMPDASKRRLIVHGHSLGSFITGNIVSQRTLDGVVLESSATSAEEWVQGFADRSIWIRKALVDSTLKGRGNSSIMATLDEPVLIVAGQNDETTKPEMSKALFEQATVANDKKELLIVAGAGHMPASNTSAYRNAFLRLLRRAQTHSS